MLKDSKIARDDLILKDGTGWNIDSITMVGNDDHRTLQHRRWPSPSQIRDTHSQRNAFAEGHIARHRQTVQLQTVGDALKSGEEIFDLVTQTLAVKSSERQSVTLLKLVPSLTKGTEGNER